METAFLDQLCLRGIPEVVMSIRGFEPFERVSPRSGVRCVLRQGSLCPIGERLVPIIVGAMATDIVSEFPPSNQFIEERFCVLAGASPS